MCICISNWKKKVEFNDANSDMMTLTTGIHLVSMLSPLLFSIYINDIANEVAYSTLP